MPVDVEFRKKVLDLNIKNTLQFCYTCARCDENCPVLNYSGKDYSPRNLIAVSLLGMKDMLDTLVNENLFALWGCTVCDTCDEVCPGDLELTEVFSLLKNLSVQEGKVPEAYLGQAKAIAENGYAIPLMAAIERRRDGMGLAKPALADVEQVKTLLKEVGFNDRVKLPE